MVNTATSASSGGGIGHIEQLVVENFKSYAGVHQIGPFRDFTCIIGPNGSGKSNLMDAVSFVLGIKTGAMRAQHLKELIYNVDGREVPKYARVQLDFMTSGGKLVQFERTIHASGATEYRIAGKGVEWAKYEETLRSLNVLVNTRNCLIFQGEVESMAHKSPNELTQMIEAVTGSADLKAEYDTKKKAYEEANERLRSATRQKRGAGVEKGMMKAHKLEAERYHTLMNDLQSVKVDHALLQFYHIETQLVQTKKQQEQVSSQSRKIEDANKEAEQQYQSKKAEIASLHKEVLKFMKLEREKQHSLDVRRRAATEHEEQMKGLLSKIEKTRAALQAAKRDGKVQTDRLQQLERDLQEQKAILASHEKAWKDEDAKGGDLSAADYKEFLRLRAQAQSETIGRTQELKQLHRELEHVKHQIDSLENAERDHQRRKKAASERLQMVEKRMREIGGEGDESNQQKDEWNKELLSVKGQIERHKAELAKKETALKQVSVEVASMRHDRDESKTEARMRQALQDMQRLFTGVRGRLCDLVTIPNPRHKLATAVALGKNLEAIVTDTDRTAHNCVQYLKEQRIGTAAFIPLQSVRGKEVTDQQRVLGGTAKPVADCLKYEPWLAPAVRYAIGQAILCDDLTEAQRVAWEHPSGQYKVVTLDGTVLQKNGVMTGGAKAMESRTRKFDEKTLEARKELRDKLVQEIKVLHMEVVREEERERDLASQVEAENQRARFARSDVEQWKQKHRQVLSELESLEREEKAFKPALKKLADQRAALESKTSGMQAAISEIESKILGDFGKRVKIHDVRDYERRVLDRDRDRMEKRSRLMALINRLQAQIDYEKKRDLPATPAELEKVLKRLEGEAKTKSSVTGKTKEVKQSEGELKEVKEKLDGLNNQLKAKEGELKAVKRTLAAKHEELDTVRKQRQQVLTILEKLRAQRSSLYTRCITEDIELPLTTKKRDTGDDGTRTTVSSEDMGAKTDDKGFITVSEIFASHTQTAPTGKRTTSDPARQAAKQLVGIDFTELADKLRREVQKGEAAYKEQLAELEKEMEKLNEELDRLAPNLKASEKYKDIEGKVVRTTEGFDLAREEQRKAHLEFNKVKEKRYQRFMRGYDIICNSVDSIYRELTMGTRAQGAAGNAYLTLEDVDEPYLAGTKFTAMPPMKRFREMEQLSGGEKTVASLALLFSLHRVCPSPFFILDEVDAALDAGNVDKVISFVRSNSSKCQFLVISLKDIFYETAQGLVGVHKEGERDSSAVKTLDLTQFAETEG
eukprot:Sspe_Gene.7740::Locus_2624_Transcript_1_1_Confidence_1.000_Length_3987::g.7740::m.7740/K06636/SMC1; structural maintenance of chromosome 1